MRQEDDEQERQYMSNTLLNSPGFAVKAKSTKGNQLHAFMRDSLFEIIYLKAKMNVCWHKSTMTAVK